ncbi:MAG: transposase family protein [Ktedonobacteraceae bacterium]
MKDITISASLTLPNQALVFDLDALYVSFEQLADGRRRQGLRYPLADLLLIGVLAKLARYDTSRAMAHWAKLLATELATLFHLKRAAMPHYSTWSRVLGSAVEPQQVEGVLGQFFCPGKPAGSAHTRQYPVAIQLQVTFSSFLALRISRTAWLLNADHLCSFALWTTFSSSLVGRDSYDYYGHSVSLEVALGRKSHGPSL